MNENPAKARTFGVLALAHTLNDMYATYLPQVLPFIVAATGFSLTRATSIAAIFTIFSSLSQPIFGYLVDQKNQRWVVFVGTFWMSVFLGLTGLTTNYGYLLIISALAGIGTAAFHPQAASMVSTVNPTRQGFVMSSFIAMGNLGMALAPLIFIPFFQKFGLGASPYLIIPGTFTALFLFFFAPRLPKRPVIKINLRETLAKLQGSTNELSKLMVIVAMRSLVHTGLMTFLRFYFVDKKLPILTSSYVLFVMLASGAVGGMVGGHLSDSFGRKPLIICSLVLATPLLYAFMLTEGMLSFILLALGTASLLASFSVTVVAAQELIPENKALASGLSLGFAIGMGGLAVTFIGKVADTYGLETALYLVMSLPLVAGVLGFTMHGGALVPAKSNLNNSN